MNDRGVSVQGGMSSPRDGRAVRRPSCFALSAVIAAAMSHQAMAQDVIAVAAEEAAPAASADRKPAQRRLIEEVIVTSQKREQSLQDVPLSVQALNAEQLDMRGIADPVSLPQVTPGLVFNYAAAFTVIYLRGIGADGFVLADPSVAMYVDGIYFPFSAGAAQSFGQVERIEVLKGPQGTLFGRNALGGAISVTTQTPSFTDASGSLTSSYSEYAKSESRAYLNLPLADNIALSVSGQYNVEDNFRSGTVAGSPLPGEVTKGARVKLRWSPVEGVDVQLAAVQNEQAGVASSFGTLGDPSPLATALLMQAQPKGNGKNDAPAYFGLDSTVFYGQGTFETDWFDIKALGSTQDVVANSLYDFDGTPVPVATFKAQLFADVQTGEIQLISNDSSWNADRLQWIAGYYYFTSKQGLDPARFAVAGSVIDGISSLVDALPVGSFLDALNIVLPNTEDGLLDASGVLLTDSNSLYGQATYHLSDQWALTLGGRYQDEKRTIGKSVGAVVTPLGNLQYLSARRNSDTTKSFSPKISLEARLWDDGLVYLSWQRATKSSTYNVINFLPFLKPLQGESLVPQKVKPEEISAYELGLKTTLFDHSTRLNAAVFWYDLKDTQVQFVSLLAGGVVTFENAPKARVKGIEFDLVSQLLPSVFSNLVLTAGATLLDTEYLDYPCGQGFAPNTGFYSPCMDLSGSRIGRAPKFTGSASLSQTFEVPGGPLEIAADYYYNSGYYYLAQENPDYEEPAYGVLGAHVSYRYEPWRLRVTVFGRNILDKYYRAGIIPTDFGAIDNPAPPSVYGARLSWDF